MPLKNLGGFLSFIGQLRYAGIPHSVIRQRHFMPADLLMPACIDPCAENMCNHLCTETNTENVFVRFDRPLDKKCFILQKGILFHLIDRHGSAHDHEMRKSAYRWCILTLFQVDYGIGQFLCTEMFCDRAGSFAGYVLYDQYVHMMILL